MENTIYKNRRNNLKNSLPMNSVLLIPGADCNIEMQIQHFLLDKIVVFTTFQDFVNLHLNSYCK
jgi:hypothetical protein